MSQTDNNYRYHPDGEAPDNGQVFCFGSNLLGAHGRGAALYAKQRCGAVYGQGIGFMKEARTGRACYAIPTKDRRIMTLPLDAIQEHVNNFITFATEHSELTFFMTRIGCVLAGYKDSQIAPLFIGAPDNILFPEPWEHFLNKPVTSQTPKP